MPSSDSLQVGLEALQQGYYLDAICALEAFCQNSDPSSKPYLQAKMYLVKAYQKNGQPEPAIALCQQLIASPQPQVSQWARKSLATLTAGAANSQANSAAQAQAHRPNKQLLQAGQEALQEKRYEAAIQSLEKFCQSKLNSRSVAYQQAKMALVRAYQGNRQYPEAIALCEQLADYPDPLIQDWVNSLLPGLRAAQQRQLRAASQANPPQPEAAHPSEQLVSAMQKAGRASQMGVKLAMRGISANLALASGVTISLLFGMVLALMLSLMLIVDSQHPGLGLIIAIAVTIIFNTLVFFLAPFFMDLSQRWLYGTRWISLTELERYSPEAVRVIQRICSERRLKQPQLGLIADENPTAFTYGSLPDTARLVVSKGLFTYLDDDEVAAVYAHELGHIVHWDFAIMTVASTLVQITYLLYVYAREVGDRIGDKRIRSVVFNTAIAAYIFHWIGTYLLLYLSRTREYFADHFSAEVTGNPNGLSRALVKIAYGIVEQGEKDEKPSRLIEGTRALGICDSKAASSTGTAYRVAADPQQVGRIFLWDLFNPWGWWMELQSTHPLTGKRIRALSTYAEQLGLDVEFEMSQVVAAGRRLNQRRLYGNFVADLILYRAETIGIVVGLGLGWMMLTTTGNPLGLLAFAFLLGGIGLLLKTFVMYPSFRRSPQTDVLSLMSDPYASPLRGQPVMLEGKIIGRGDAGYIFGSDFKFQDATGMIFLRYASLLGPIGNLFFGATQAEGIVRSEGIATGWFRRGIAPSVDLFQFNDVRGYHRFWSCLIGGLSIMLGFFLLTLSPG